MLGRIFARGGGSRSTPNLPSTTVVLLPSDDEIKVSKDMVGESARAAKQLFLLITGAYAYCAVTVATLDGREILVREKIVLPLLGLPVPFRWFFVVSPLLLIFLHWYFYLHIKQMRQFIEEIPATDRVGLFPWIVTQDYVSENRRRLDIRSLWVEIGLWHYWPAILIASSIASIRIQNNLIVIIGLAASLISVLSSFRFRRRYYEKQTRSKFVYRICLILLLAGIGLNGMLAWVARSDVDLKTVLGDDFVYDRVQSVIGVDCSNQIYHAQEGPSSLIADRRNLRRASFRSSIIPGFRCNDCNLQNADFRDAVIVGGNFHHADFSGADFRNAICYHCDLSKAILKRVNFAGAKIIGSKIGAADLQDAIFFEARIDSVEFGQTQADVARTFYRAKEWYDQDYLASLRRRQPKLVDGWYYTDH